MERAYIEALTEMPFLAHTENAYGIPHVLRDHLQTVGDLARYFAVQTYPALGPAARWAGHLHDLGRILQPGKSPAGREIRLWAK